MDYATIGPRRHQCVAGVQSRISDQNPSVTIRGTNGDPTRALASMSSATVRPARRRTTRLPTNDFTGGTVDALINYLCVGRGRSGNNSTVGGSGVLTFDNGSINANTLAIGFHLSERFQHPCHRHGERQRRHADGRHEYHAWRRGRMSAAAVRPAATLNVNGGTVQATNIVGGGGTAIINLNSGTLICRAGQISNVTTLTIGDGICYPPRIAQRRGNISFAKRNHDCRQRNACGKYICHDAGFDCERHDFARRQWRRRNHQQRRE